jgi:hypothetical protein
MAACLLLPLSAPADAGECKNAFNLDAYPSKEKGEYGLEKFYFYAPFFERIVYGFKLDKIMGEQAAIAAAFAVYTCVNKKLVTVFRVCNFRDGKHLIFTFYPKDFDGRRVIMCKANYIKDGEKLLGEDESDKNQWAMIYYLIGKRLVNYSYITRKEEKKEYDRMTWKANDYLLDDEAGNDAEIEKLLLDDLKEPKNNDIGMTYVILSQYYASVGRMAEARKALAKAKARPGDNKCGDSLEDICRITEMEIKAVEKQNGGMGL